MTRRSKIEAKRLAEAEAEFIPLLRFCLEQASRGRVGLFGDNDEFKEARWFPKWPEARRVKELAEEIQLLEAGIGGPNAVCQKFLEMYSLRGANVPGETKRAGLLLDELGWR